jgi:small-conductance mechanosensitive channel
VFDFLEPYTQMAVWIAGSAAVGLVIDTIIYTLLKRRAEKLHQKVGQEVARSLQGLPTALAIILGVRIGATRASLEPDVAAFIDTLLIIMLILVLTAFASRIAGRLIRVYTSREDAALPSSSIFVNFARGVIWIIGGLTLLAALEVSIAPLLTALGVGGLAVGLALQDTLSNLFSGIQVLLSGQIKPGDFIQLETGEEGWVHDVTWRNTTIKMLSNDLVIVPNAKLGSELVTNYTSLDTQHIVWTEVGVAYGSDLDHVERVVRGVATDVAANASGADPEYESLFRYYGFGDSSINLRVSIRAHEYADRYPLQDAMIKALHKAFAAEGIEIPFPQRTVHMPGAESGGEAAPEGAPNRT